MVPPPEGEGSLIRTEAEIAFSFFSVSSRPSPKVNSKSSDGDTTVVEALKDNQGSGSGGEEGGRNS